MMKVLRIRDLFVHESVDRTHLMHLKERIKSDRILKKPILVDEKTNIILDGHHRFEALRLLGYTKIPAVLVDYQNPKVKVSSNRAGFIVTKTSVINAGLNARLFPSKTSRHYYDRSVVVNISLDELR